MDSPQVRTSLVVSHCIPKLVLLLGFSLLLSTIFQDYTAMRTNPSSSFIAAIAASLARHGEATSVDLSWHAPSVSAINNLTQVISGEGVYGWVYNSSVVAADQYGVYNWCNMPHVRSTEYKKPSSEYNLQYVEVVSLPQCP